MRENGFEVVGTAAPLLLVGVEAIAFAGEPSIYPTPRCSSGRLPCLQFVAPAGIRKSLMEIATFTRSNVNETVSGFLSSSFPTKALLLRDKTSSHRLSFALLIVGPEIEDELHDFFRRHLARLKNRAGLVGTI